MASFGLVVLVLCQTLADGASNRTSSSSTGRIMRRLLVKIQLPFNMLMWMFHAQYSHVTVS